MENIFIDLHKELRQLSSNTVDGRVEEFKIKNAGVFLYAVGGFPVQNTNGEYFLFDKKITKNSLTQVVKEALGLSGVLTFMNKSDLSLDYLGHVCQTKEHFWALNWLNISLMVCINDPEKIEYSLLRSKKFFQSWPVTQNGTSQVFGITGSLRDFRKFVAHRNDSSFDGDTLGFMNLLHKNFSFLWEFQTDL